MGHRFGYRTSAAERAGRYNHQHQRARAAAAKHHQPHDPCTRCGKPLGPMGSNLHYDHTDDGTAYLGFAHAACNVRAGAIRGNQRQHQAAEPTRTRRTRAW